MGSKVGSFRQYSGRRLNIYYLSPVCRSIPDFNAHKIIITIRSLKRSYTPIRQV